MTHDQLIPALIAALLAEDVAPERIDAAVSQVRAIKLGDSIIPGDDPLFRAFAYEQAKRLEDA